LQINNQIYVWTEQKEAFNRLTGRKLYEIIDGAAQEYIQQGLVERIHQQFTNERGKTVKLFAEDFESAE
jgi:hypothetical protein